MRKPNRKFYSKLASEAEIEAVLETLRLECHIARIREYNRMLEAGDYVLAGAIYKELVNDQGRA